nr:hypothetical protein [Nocardia otitidiscaviarum]
MMGTAWGRGAAGPPAPPRPTPPTHPPHPAGPGPPRAPPAATEVDGVGSQVGVDADVTSDAAALRVRLPVRYPLPVARIAESCRTHLIARVGELAGLTVTGVDIEISAMELEPAAPATDSARRRVR